MLEKAWRLASCPKAEKLSKVRGNRLEDGFAVDERIKCRSDIRHAVPRE